LVLQGTVEAEQIYVHARALELYGSPPVPQTGHAELCIADGNFVIAGARSCSTRRGQRPVAFTAVKPIETDLGLTATLSEEAEYNDDQARLAGIQRLLLLCGYDVNPIDGIPGKKTDTAITQFLKDHQLANEAAIALSFFDVLADAATKTQSAFAWCNDTAYTVMASLGVENDATIVTRLVPDRAGPVPQTADFPPTATALQLCRSRRQRRPNDQAWGPMANVGGHHDLVHAPGSLRDQRSHGLRRERARHDGICAHRSG
jgi:uncharacterized membrane protein